MKKATYLETRAATAETAANKAIARLRQYESELKAEMGTHGRDGVVSDLIAYANTGKPSDIPGRAARAQAIKTVLAAIPQVISRIEEKLNETQRARNQALNADVRAAKKAYIEGLSEFDEHYKELAHSPDHAELLKAADELVRLAGNALMMTDLRKHFREKWRNRHRAADLARY